MSKKWQRNKAWEDANLVGSLTPIRVILRVFSSVPTAIVLLLFVSIYAMLASIPVGMIARIPTLLVVTAMYLILLAVPILPALYITRKGMQRTRAPLRFLMMFLVTVGLGIGMTLLWRIGIWPALKYHTSDGSGFMLFREFVEKYKSTTIRRMPMLEMTETQFYAWWPMRLALVLFVINLIVATIRRIEFNFKNLGVLSVHTGIVIIALGSIFYQRFKLEGDTLLPAGASGMPGPAQRAFYDREDVALYVAQARTPNAQPQFEQRPLNDLPLYNAYGLEAGIPAGATTLSQVLQREVLDTDEGRTLDQPVPAGAGALVDPDIRFRAVGFAPYAELEDEWFEADAPINGPSNPYRKIDLYFTRSATPGQQPDADPIFMFPFIVGEPANRIRFNDLMAIEYTRGMDEQRWDDLGVDLRGSFTHRAHHRDPRSGIPGGAARERRHPHPARDHRLDCRDRSACRRTAFPDHHAGLRGRDELGRGAQYHEAGAGRPARQAVLTLGVPSLPGAQPGPHPGPRRPPATKRPRPRDPGRIHRRIETPDLPR